VGDLDKPKLAEDRGETDEHEQGKELQTPARAKTSSVHS
jgi:hypothetical protein